MSHLGDLLKTEREKKGIRLTDIASVTKIPLLNLKAIEEGKWGVLPPPPFIKGFLTSYSRFVGLDPIEIYKLYRAETEKPAESSNPTLEEAPVQKEISASEVIASPKVFRVKPIAVTTLALFGLGLSLWLIRFGKQELAPQDEGPVASASVPAQIPPPITEPDPNLNREPASSATPEKIEPVKVDSPPAAPPAPETHELQVTAKERTWVKVVIDDSPPVELYLNPTEKTKYSAKEKIKLVLGNSTGAEVLHNGTVNEGLKFQGTIRSYVFPAQAKFPQDKPTRKLTEEDLPRSSESEPTGEFILE